MGCWIRGLSLNDYKHPHPQTAKREPGPNEADTRVGEFWLPFLFLVEGGQIREGDAGVAIRGLCVVLSLP